MPELIIGLEIHVELNTKTKMYCSCRNEFGAIPNTNICPVCLAHPGAIPVMNKEAVEYALLAGHAFHCDIHPHFKMDRKKYFYPDLTKGYQITQEDEPICTGGYIEVDAEDGKKKIRLERIHLEEDTGASTHTEEGYTLLDYNRAGVPLIEIVTKPDLSSADEVSDFLNQLRDTILFLGISDVKMAEGSLRCDVNINLKDDDFRTGISEIKNLNSFRAITRAIEYEEKRHRELFKEKDIGGHETRRWDEQEAKTLTMRAEDEGDDYRFTAEVDIPYTELSEERIVELKESLPELPKARKNRFLEEYDLSEYDADILTRDRELADFFEEVEKEVKDSEMVANWVITDVLRRVNEHEMEFSEMKMSAENLGKLILLVKNGKINNNTGKKVLRSLFEENFDPEKYVEEKGLIQVSDEGKLEEVVDEVLGENPQSIEDIKAGRDRAIGFLVGQCMKKTRGQGNPQMFNEMIQEKIKEH